MIFSTKQHQDLRSYALVLFSFFLPLFPRVATWIVVIWFLAWLISLQPVRYLRNLRSWEAWPPIAYFLFFLLATSWSAFSDKAGSLLETQLSLLVFPLLLLVGPPRSAADLSRLVRPAFLLGCSAAMLICLAWGIWNYPEQGFAGLSYTQLGDPLSFHPTYFALYLNFGIFWAVAGLRNRELPRWGAYAFVLLALPFIILLAARMQWILLLLVGSGSFLWIQWRQGKLKQGIVWSLLALVFIGGLSWTIPTTRHRIKRAVAEFSGGAGEENIRMQLWQSAWDGWKEAPILGHGTGAGQEVLLLQYQRIGCEICQEDPLNAHNQYLETAVAGGTMGFLLLLGIFLIPLWQLREKDPGMLRVLLLLFGLSILTESMFATQRGTMFFGFFYTFLIWKVVSSPKGTEA